VRRGSEYAQISSIAFDSSSKWLACCSDTSTIHIFRLNNPQYYSLFLLLSKLHRNEQSENKKGDENLGTVANPKSK